MHTATKPYDYIMDMLHPVSLLQTLESILHVAFPNTIISAHNMSMFCAWRKDVRLPVQLQRAMAAEAEAAREARAKVSQNTYLSRCENASFPPNTRTSTGSKILLTEARFSRLLAALP